METKKIGKRLVTVAAIPIVALLMTSMLAHDTSLGGGASDIASFKNYVVVYKNGELVAWGPNVVTDIGLNHTRDALMGRLATSIVSNISVLQLSTNATAVEAGEQACFEAVFGNGLTAAAGTRTEQDSHTGNYSINKTWEGTGTVASIASVCTHNGTVTANNITFSRSLLSSTVNMENGDTLSVFYYIDVS